MDGEHAEPVRVGDRDGRGYRSGVPDRVGDQLGQDQEGRPDARVAQADPALDQDQLGGLMRDPYGRAHGGHGQDMPVQQRLQLNGRGTSPGFGRRGTEPFRLVRSAAGPFHARRPYACEQEPLTEVHSRGL